MSKSSSRIGMRRNDGVKPTSWRGYFRGTSRPDKLIAKWGSYLPLQTKILLTLMAGLVWVFGMTFFVTIVGPSLVVAPFLYAIWNRGNRITEAEARWSMTAGLVGLYFLFVKVYAGVVLFVVGVVLLAIIWGGAIHRVIRGGGGVGDLVRFEGSFRARVGAAQRKANQRKTLAILMVFALVSMPTASAATVAEFFGISSAFKVASCRAVAADSSRSVSEWATASAECEKKIHARKGIASSPVEPKVLPVAEQNPETDLSNSRVLGGIGSAIAATWCGVSANTLWGCGPTDGERAKMVSAQRALEAKLQAERDFAAKAEEKRKADEAQAAWAADAAARAALVALSPETPMGGLIEGVKGAADLLGLKLEWREVEEEGNGGYANFVVEEKVIIQTATVETCGQTKVADVSYLGEKNGHVYQLVADSACAPLASFEVTIGGEVKRVDLPIGRANTQLADDGVIHAKDGVVVISGTAKPGTTIGVSGGSVEGAVVVGADGVYVLEVDASELVSGKHVVVITPYDEGGLPGPSVRRTIVKDISIKLADVKLSPANVEIGEVVRVLGAVSCTGPSTFEYGVSWGKQGQAFGEVAGGGTCGEVPAQVEFASHKYDAIGHYFVSVRVAIPGLAEDVAQNVMVVVQPKGGYDLSSPAHVAWLADSDARAANEEPMTDQEVVVDEDGDIETGGVEDTTFLDGAGAVVHNAGQAAKGAAKKVGAGSLKWWLVGLLVVVALAGGFWYARQHGKLTRIGIYPTVAEVPAFGAQRFMSSSVGAAPRRKGLFGLFKKKPPVVPEYAPRPQANITFNVARESALDDVDDGRDAYYGRG